MKIQLLNTSLESKYESYILASNSGMFFYSLKYKDFLENLLKCESLYYLVVDGSDNIKGVMPIMVFKGKYGVVYNSLPFYGSHGGILASDAGAVSLLLDKFNEISSFSDTAVNMLITNPLNEDYVEPNNDFTDTRVSQITQIQYSKNISEQLLLNFHSKTRNMIRKSLKSGLDIEVDNNAFGFLEHTHKENMAAIGGMAKSSAFFSLIPQFFEADTDYKIYVAKKGRDKVAAVLLFYYKDMVEYFTPVIKSEFRALQPLSLLIYNAMIDAATKGYRLWNWGGTWLSQEGVYRFKNRFGAIDREYKYYIRLNNPKVLEASKDELAGQYPGFYTVPFNRLNND